VLRREARWRMLALGFEDVCNQALSLDEAPQPPKSPTMFRPTATCVCVCVCVCMVEYEDWGSTRRRRT